MENRQIVRQFIDNLIPNPDTAYETFAEHVTAEWPGSGMPEVKGKDALVKLFRNNGHNTLMSQQVDELIAEGNAVCGRGSVITEKGGKKQTHHFADFYTVENGKITQLVSYII